MTTNRREFLGASIAGLVLAAAKPAHAANGHDWYTRSMRWQQLVLNENDPGKYDVGYWMDYYERTHTEGLCLSAGGLVAYYPTQIPFHHRSTWMLPGQDPFGDFVSGCRKREIAIVARTDCHAIRPDAAAAHPEWLSLDSTGQRRPHWALPDRWLTCAYGPYNFDYMTAIHRELVTRYEIDGLFVNRWQGSGLCYCDSCKSMFRKFAAAEIPTEINEQDPVFAQYVEWSQSRLIKLWGLWDGEIRKVNPNARYFTNNGLRYANAAKLAPMYISEQQQRDAVPLWATGLHAKTVRAGLPGCPVMGMAASYFVSRGTASPEAELRMWLLDAIANGARPWVIKSGATVTDDRWIKAVETVYDWHWRNERYLKQVSNLARVGIVFRRGLRDITGVTGTGGGSKKPVPDVGPDLHQSGVYHALVGARIPTDMVHDQALDAQTLTRFKVLGLPNVTRLSDAQCGQLRDYVMRGGTLIATFETSLYDETGRRRENFGLSDIFGVDYAGGIDRGQTDTFMRIERGTKHPILEGFGHVDKILAPTDRVRVKARAGFEPPPLTLVPTFPTSAMEEAYPRISQTDVPQVYIREFGKGRVVYFPGDIDRSYWKSLLPDQAKLIANVFEWSVGDDQAVTVSGLGVLDVVCWRQSSSLTVHMVNLTNPMMLRSPISEIIPIGEQSVRLRVPSGVVVQQVRLLVSNRTIAATQVGNIISFSIPSIFDHEVAAIDTL